MSVDNNLLKANKVYKPMAYPDAFKHWEDHDKMVWHWDEVPLADDVINFNKADESERTFITQLLRLFTQNDVEVGDGYDTLLRIFKPTEVKMMLRSNSDRESTHVAAYANFTEVLGFDDSFYSEFLDVPIMKDKIDYIEKAKVKKYEDYEQEHKDLFLFGGWTKEPKEDYIDRRYKQDIIRMMAVYATATEGISLFAQFAMLLKYQTENKYKGLGTLVEWSIKDEEQHVKSNSWLLRTFIKENQDVFTDEVKFDVYEAVRQIVAKEEALVDYLNPPHMDKEVVKTYIRYIADQRLKLIGFKPNWNIVSNPLPFMEEITGVTMTNFFEGKATEYTKGALTGDWDKVRRNV